MNWIIVEGVYETARKNETPSHLALVCGRRSKKILEISESNTDREKYFYLYTSCFLPLSKRKRAKSKEQRYGFIIIFMEESILLKKAKNFALNCIILYKKLQAENEFVISKQLLRSSTSIGANLREARAWQSKKDFYAKICIAYKEAHESLWWLELLDESNITNIDVSVLQSDCKELIRMLAKTKLTTEKNLNFDSYEK